MNSLKILRLTLVLSLAFANTIQASEPAAFIEFVRPLGMGGAFTAVADDHNTFFYNPAGMVMRTGGQYTLLEVVGGISQDAKTLMDYISDNKDKLTDFDDLPTDEQEKIVNDIDTNISKLDSRFYAAANISSYVSGPRFMGMPIHAGFGAFAKVDASAKLNTSASGVPLVSYSVDGDLVLPLSLAHRWDAPWVPGRIGVGVTGKLLRRGQVRQDNISTITLDDIKVPPASIGHAFGGDLGVLYQPTERTNIGVMVQDILGTKMHYQKADAKDGYPEVAAHDSVIRPRTNIGIALNPKKLLWLIPTAERWTFSGDIRDVFSPDEHVLFQEGFKKPIGENFGTHAYVGAEFRYWFLRFRGGAYQGYPSAGLGVDLPFLKLDYAYYSRELGPLAGDDRQINHALSLAFRFGANYTESRERIVKNKESKNVKPDAVPESVDTAAPTSNAAPASNGAAEKPVEDEMPR